MTSENSETTSGNSITEREQTAEELLRLIDGWKDPNPSPILKENAWIRHLIANAEVDAHVRAL